jgi:hypothetical protein
MRNEYLHQKMTHVECNHKGCTSTNAVILMDKMAYCADHAYYKQTGRILHLDMREDEKNANV